MDQIWGVAVVGLAALLGAGCNNVGACNDAKHRAAATWKGVATHATVQGIMFDDDGTGPFTRCELAARIAAVGAIGPMVEARRTADAATAACAEASDATAASKSAWEVCSRIKN